MPAEKDAKHGHEFEEHFFGAATVGERGQIVIPAEARKRYNIETGDKLLIMGTRNEKGLMLFKIDAMREFMTKLLEDLQRVEKEDQNTDKTEDTAA